MMDGYRVGMILAQKWVTLKTSILWTFPKMLKAIDKKMKADWENPKPRKKKFWEEFFQGWKNNKKISFVHCESCGALGIDWKSDKHGWHYHGYHIWSCPKCKTHDEEYMQKAQDWYAQHTDHVEGLLKHADRAFKACDEDLNHPELWKPGS